MEIVRTEKLTDERWLNLYAATFRHGDHTGRWVYASRKDPAERTDAADAVVIVPVLRFPHEPPRLVMIREYRVPIGGYNYGLPAGLFEKGESVEETVRRELLEETGLQLVKVKRISPKLYSSTGMTDESALLVFVDVVATEGSIQQLESSEVIEPVLLDYEQVCTLCDDPEIGIDAKAWAVLYLYQQLGRIE